ncbi:MAG: nucleotide-binding universal stress UspA family protein [Vicingaceae bacterium]|jgi:nucleotide-binding universal stress UspA family protein
MKAFEFTNDFFTGDNFKYVVATVYDIPRGGTSSLFSLMEKLRNQANDEMDSFMEALKKKYPTIHATAESVVLQGSFADQVIGLANDSNANFVVMGTKGASGMKEVLLGSNAADLVNDATLPIFAIPQEYERKNIKNILLSYDGNSLTDNTISFIGVLSRAFKLPINLFHVRTKADQPIQNWGEIENRFNDHHISLYEAFAETFEDGLKSEIADLNSLLVLVSRKKSFWNRLMRGSQSKKAIMHFHLPMLVLPEK